jgi:predicted alpha/beta-hydrolase family hydrolase
MRVEPEPFARDYPDGPSVRGYLHAADAPSDDALVLTHGAGFNRAAPLLVALADQFAGAGVATLRCDLPYRQARPKGPPHRGAAARDREGLRRAVEAVREFATGRVFLGGQSYGGRQATLLAAEDSAAVDGLLLISYPLHPPGKPESLRTAHFPELQVAAFFAHGSKDAFGSLDQMRGALDLIPASHQLYEVGGGGHGLMKRGAGPEVISGLAAEIRRTFARFMDGV